MSGRTCGDCVHLDERIIDTWSKATRPLRRCEKRLTLEFADTPRGDPESFYACPHFTTESDVTG
jgi:hypothetical protein